MIDLSIAPNWLIKMGFYSLNVILFIFIFWFLCRNKKPSTYIFYIGIPLCCMLGFYRLGEVNKRNPLDSQFEDKVKVEVYGTIQEIEEREDYNIYYLKDNQIQLDSSETYYYSRKIKMTSAKSNIRIGNKVCIDGTLYKFSDATNPGQFNESQYYRIRRIDYKLKENNIIVLDKKESIYKGYLHSIKMNLRNTYYKILPSREATVLSAMILGESHLLDDEIKLLYSKSGISHILAISGLHISLIGSAIYHFLRKLKVPNVLVTILSILIMFSYGILTNFSVSTNRSIVMFVCLVLGKLVGRTYDTLTATALSGLIILIQSPYEITNVGFLLSFGAIIAIAIIVPFLKQHIIFLEQFKNQKSLVKYISYQLLDGMIVSIGVQIMIQPILLYYFYEISVYSILINVIILPLSSILILLGLSSGIIGLCSVAIAKLSVGAAFYILKLYEIVCMIGSRLPYAVVLIGKPSIESMLIYYLILVALLLLNSKKLRKRTLFLLPFLLIIFYHRKEAVEVTFLDVGQGDGIYLEYKHDLRILVDSGSSSVTGVGTYRLIPFLKSKGISKLDYVILTHYDEDHISGIQELLDKIELDREKNIPWYTGTIRIDTLVLPHYDRENEKAVRLIEQAKRCGIQLITMIAGDFIELDEFCIKAVYPEKGRIPSTSNGTSTVLHVSYQEFDMLLTGDMEEEGEKILAKNINSSVDVLKVAHHGSRNSSSLELLEKLKPAVSIISAGYKNSYGHPHQEVLERLHFVGSDYYMTMNCGAITITTDGRQHIIKRFR